jgi:hypothetical protein
LGAFEALSDQIYLFLRGLDACLRFLLEGMEDIHHLGKAHGIDRAEGVAPMIFNNLKIPGPSPFHGLAFGCLAPSCAKPKA